MPEDERIAKYEAWLTELEDRIAKLGRSRVSYVRFFVGAALLSVFGFFFNVWVGVGTLGTGIMFCGTGLYMILVRTDEYRREIRRTRFEIDRLRVNVDTD